MQVEQVHEGHRERMRKQLRQFGMDSLSDVQVLEVLLYYAYARQDTNPMAHALLRRFGSLAGVFEKMPGGFIFGILFYLLLLILLCPKVWRRQTNGRAYPMYMIAYGGFRFVTEFFRDQSTTFLFHLSHLWAGVSFCIGISIYAEINNQKHIGKRRS